MRIQRRFSDSKIHPFEQAEYERRSCMIKNTDGSVVFEMHDVEVPKEWSQLASDILISKYIRKAGLPGTPGHETSIRQVVHRIVHSIRVEGERSGKYFDSPADAENFERDLDYILLHQMGAFNSPVWFNCGLFHEYGIGGAGGNWHWNDQTHGVEELTENYRAPQCSACFIQSVQDDLMSIFDLVKNEARIFKYGSGTGTNFSNIRGRQEHLSGGGTSSGLMSFLEVFDRAAGATKSGGTTRRAAKMVCLDADHPEIRDFVNWKRKEEKKVRALIESGYSADFNGEAYHTVAGQNSNNSIRITDEFMNAFLEGKQWQTLFRTTGQVCETFPARDLMDDISTSAWECADPGVQFDTIINDWHTCPVSGPIKASNPCSEFMFLDDTACNLASINLMKYLREDGSFDLEGFLHTIRLFILAQEILVDFSSYPTKQIAYNSHLFRPLGLGYANLGSLLMVNGLPYDSDGGRAMAGAITAILTGHSYYVSAEIASTKGTFEEFPKNAKSMLRVIGKHRDALNGISADKCPPELLKGAHTAWDMALKAGEKHGYRNSQVSVLAPTGTIGLLMDCDTTGIEPDFSLVKFKKLAGGGYFKIVNQTVFKALRRLGYSPTESREIVEYAVGIQRLDISPNINTDTLKEKGLTPEEIAKAEKALPGAFELENAFSSWVLGPDVMERQGFTADQYQSPNFNFLKAIGFTAEETDEAARVICGTMTIEGAPHLKPEHYPVFDCANRCGALGTRYIEPMGHIRMMSGVQAFISGAISKTVNMPNSATVEEIEAVYVDSWRMGLKAVALYRDGCKSSQPLSSKKAKKEEEVETSKEVVPSAGQLELFPELAEKGLKRRLLPRRRSGLTVEARIAGHKVYLRTGDYDDGSLGEIFIDMHKEGSAFRSMIMCFAIAVSKGLQYGVPLREFVDTFTFTSFEPRGICDHPNIKMVNSVIDYVFRVLGLEYLGRTDFCQVKPTIGEEPGEGAQGAPSAQGALENKPGPKSKNGSNGKSAEAAAPKPVGVGVRAHAPVGAAMSPAPAASNDSPIGRQLSEMMGDAPFCDICGHITVRNGACYKCLNCGNSIGCS